MMLQIGLGLAERGLVPLTWLRWGIRGLLVARLNEQQDRDTNSALQRRFLESRAPSKVTVITTDMNTFDTAERFDRIVSIEMFEHMRNHRVLLRRIASWLRPGGKLFIHIFCHPRYAYAFEAHGAANWMGRHFFTGGIMPSTDLLLTFADEFMLEQR